MDITIKNRLFEIVENSYKNFADNELFSLVKEKMQEAPSQTNKVSFLLFSAATEKRVSEYFDCMIGKAFSVWVNHIIGEMEECLQKENYNVADLFDKKCILDDIAKGTFARSALSAESGKKPATAISVQERFELIIHSERAFVKAEEELRIYKDNYAVDYIKHYFSEFLAQSFGEKSKMIHSIEYDFGKEFLFSEMTMNITEEDMKKYKSGNLKELNGSPYLKKDDYTMQVYTGGDYPRVVCISKKIPIFDSGDLAYDWWHDLYLAQEENGNIHAVYYTGGLCDSRIVGCVRVHKYPDGLKEYFESES